MKWLRIAPGVIAVLAIIDGGLVIHHGNVQRRIPAAKSECSRLQSAVGKQKYTLRHPVIKQTIPSAYKKMMDDGKQVDKAENGLIHIASQHHGKLPRNTNQYRKYHGVLQQYVSSTGSTDDNAANDIWTNHLKDTIKLIPGSGEAGGNYECAFLVSDKKGHIDNVLTATYESQSHIFTNFIVYGSYSVSDVDNSVSSNKPKKSKKPVHKHMNKKRAKKIIQRHNQPRNNKQKRGRR